jgi:hypothetical protein
MHLFHISLIFTFGGDRPKILFSHAFAMYDSKELIVYIEMRLKMNKLCVIAAVVFVLSAGNARKRIYTEPGMVLAFSTDTVSFDTVFSTIDPPPLTLRTIRKVNRLKISTIYFGGGENLLPHEFRW